MNNNNDELNYFELMRIFWDFCYENPDLIKPIHCAIYGYTVEHCNRLGWKVKFGLPSRVVMECIGVKSYKIYINGLRDLESFGFVKIIQKSKNQHTSNIVALVKNTKASTKALDKARAKANPKQVSKQVHYNKTIDPIQNTIDQNDLHRSFDHLFLTNKEYEDLCNEFNKSDVDEILDEIENYADNKKYKSLKLTAKNWLKKRHDRNVSENLKEGQKRVLPFDLGI